MISKLVTILALAAVAVSATFMETDTEQQDLFFDKLHTTMASLDRVSLDTIVAQSQVNDSSGKLSSLSLSNVVLEVPDEPASVYTMLKNEVLNVKLSYEDLVFSASYSHEDKTGMLHLRYPDVDIIVSAHVKEDLLEMDITNVSIDLKCESVIESSEGEQEEDEALKADLKQLLDDALAKDLNAVLAEKIQEAFESDEQSVVAEDEEEDEDQGERHTRQINRCRFMRCRPGFVCVPPGRCVRINANDCRFVRCPQFHRCVRGRCVPIVNVDPCRFVRCPFGKRCLRGRCVPIINSCAGIRCRPGFICRNGRCVRLPIRPI